MNPFQFRLPDKVLDAPHGLTQIGELEDAVGARGAAFDLEEPPGMGELVLDLADEVAEFGPPYGLISGSIQMAAVVFR